MSSDRTKQICLWMTIYIYIYMKSSHPVLVTLKSFWLVIFKKKETVLSLACYNVWWRRRISERLRVVEHFPINDLICSGNVSKAVTSTVNLNKLFFLYNSLYQLYSLVIPLLCSKLQRPGKLLWKMLLKIPCFAL